MAKRKGGIPGMGGNMAGMMKQMQNMQAKMEQMKDEIDNTIFEATSGGGAVTAKVSGAKVVEEIIMDPEILDPDDCEMICDMIAAAVNEALKKADDETNQKMGSLTGGLNIPGF